MTDQKEWDLKEDPSMEESDCVCETCLNETMEEYADKMWTQTEYGWICNHCVEELKKEHQGLPVVSDFGFTFSILDTGTLFIRLPGGGSYLEDIKKEDQGKAWVFIDRMRHSEN